MLNELQKNILTAYLDTPLSGITETSPAIARQVLEILLRLCRGGSRLTQIEKDLFAAHELEGDVELITRIMIHRAPQNRSTNYPYFERHRDRNMVVYKNAAGIAAFERCGLLSLTSRSDVGQIVRKRDVIDYFSMAIVHRIELLQYQVEIEELRQKLALFQGPALIRSYFAAVTEGDRTALEASLGLLFMHNLSLDVQNDAGQTALELALAVNQPKIAHAILCRKIRMGGELEVAAEQGDFVKVAQLLALGASVTTRLEQSYSALYYCAKAGETDLVSTLLAQGVEANQTTPKGNSALGWAIFNGHAAVAKLLIEHSSYLDGVNDVGETALHSAVRRGELALTNALLDAGADPSIRGICGQTVLDAAVEAKQEGIVHLLKNIGTFMPAAKRRRLGRGFAEEKAADPVAFDQELSQSIALKAEQGDWALVAQHLDNPKVDWSVCAPGDYGKTVLMNTVWQNKQRLFAQLVAKGAAINQSNQHGSTALLLAAEKNYTQMALTLINNEAAVNAQDHDKDAAIFYALTSQNEVLLSALLAHGAKLDIHHKSGQTVLEFATVIAEPALIEQLNNAQSSLRYSI